MKLSGVTRLCVPQPSSLSPSSPCSFLALYVSFTLVKSVSLPVVERAGSHRLLNQEPPPPLQDQVDLEVSHSSETRLPALTLLPGGNQAGGFSSAPRLICV